MSTGTFANAAMSAASFTIACEVVAALSPVSPTWVRRLPICPSKFSASFADSPNVEASFPAFFSRLPPISSPNTRVTRAADSSSLEAAWIALANVVTIAAPARNGPVAASVAPRSPRDDREVAARPRWKCDRASTSPSIALVDFVIVLVVEAVALPSFVVPAVAPAGMPAAEIALSLAVSSASNAVKSGRTSTKTTPTGGSANVAAQSGHVAH
ncbi:MAG TPA: hypothetical protein VGF24_37335 [Vicinamibacterales bacterium]